MKVETPQIIWHSKDSKFADRVYSLDFQPGTSRLATAGADEFIHIWEITREAEWKLKILSRLLGHEKEVNCIRFSSNGELLASGGQDDSLCIWKPTTEKQQVAFGHNSEDVLGFPEYWKRITVMRCMAPVISLSWSPDDCKVVVGTEDDRVTIWNVYTGKLLRQLDAHTHIVMGVCWDPKDEFIASQSSDQTVRIWKSKTNKPKKKSKSITVSNSNINDTKTSPKEDVEMEINNKFGGNSEHACVEVGAHTGMELTSCTATYVEQQPKEEAEIESHNITSGTPALSVTPSESSTPICDVGPIQNTAGQQTNKSDVKSWKLHHTIKYEILDNCSKQKQSNLDVDMNSELVIGDCATPNNSKLSSNNNIKRRCLFLAESATTSFFRRLDWSPKGEMLVVPTGQYLLNQEPENENGDNKNSQALFPVSYIFLRDEYSYPAAVLPSPDGTTSSIRFNPVTFCPLKTSNTSQNPFFFNRITPQGDEDSWVFSKHRNHGEIIPRYIFSVITLAGTINIYDTQHFHPIVCIRGLHFQGMNDASWSSDGHTLAVASSDGYITIIFFEDGELGEVLIPSSVPTSTSINSTIIEPKEKVFQHFENDENTDQNSLKTNNESQCIAIDNNANISVVSEKITDTSDNISTSNQIDTQIPLPAKTKRRITPTVLISYDS